MAKKVTGRKRVWQLLETVGRGDAGEVLRVQAELGREQGVMKRPVQNVSGGTIVRQARQIENEGRVLALLDGMDVERHGRRVHTPLLMDQSIEGTSSSANLFIISEEVSGVSVSELLRRKMQGGSPISQVIVLKVLAASFQLLQKVHEKGVIWNDVKMDHIFWDAEVNTLSFIDWGNSLYLNSESSDEKASPLLDYRQLLEEGRALMEQTSPELISDIGWPLSASNLNDQEINHLQMRVEYMETYLSMRIIEYKLLFSRYLSLDSLEDWAHSGPDARRSSSGWRLTLPIYWQPAKATCSVFGPRRRQTGPRSFPSNRSRPERRSLSELATCRISARIIWRE